MQDAHVHKAVIDGKDGGDLGQAILPLIHACTIDMSHAEKLAWWSALMGCLAGMACADLGHEDFSVLLRAMNASVARHAEELKAGLN